MVGLDERAAVLAAEAATSAPEERTSLKFGILGIAMGVGRRGAAAATSSQKVRLGATGRGGGGWPLGRADGPAASDSGRVRSKRCRGDLRPVACLSSGILIPFPLSYIYS